MGVASSSSIARHLVFQHGRLKAASSAWEFFFFSLVSDAIAKRITGCDLPGRIRLWRCLPG